MTVLHTFFEKVHASLDELGERLSITGETPFPQNKEFRNWRKPTLRTRILWRSHTIQVYLQSMVVQKQYKQIHRWGFSTCSWCSASNKRFHQLHPTDGTDISLLICPGDHIEMVFKEAFRGVAVVWQTILVFAAFYQNALDKYLLLHGGERDRRVNEDNKAILLQVSRSSPG